MSLNCGIVGLPNVGKSTIFSAITSAPAEAANYPFCTIEPNQGIVSVLDSRIDAISKIYGPEKKIPAICEFLDIAGLVKGASKGEGLGNQFLGHIRQVDAIAHVVRCFDDGDVIHVHGEVDPVGDIETINLELAFADLEVVEKKISGLDRALKNHNKDLVKKARTAQPVLEKLKVSLSEGIPARACELDDEEKEAVADLHLITMKKVLYVCNVDEDTAASGSNAYVEKVREFASKEGAEAIVLCGKLESEISGLESEEEKAEFLESAGIERSGLEVLVEKVYHMLGLRTYFTAGQKEVRAWTFKEGAKAPQAAGVIHTDFERGFIRAEVFHFDDLVAHKNEAGIKENGKFRVEGKEYVVQDGDIMHFRFNV